MSGIKPKARENEAGLSDKASGTAEPRQHNDQQGIVLNDKAEEQPKDHSRAQQTSSHDKPNT